MSEWPSLERDCDSVAATAAFAQQMATVVCESMTVVLSGTLGAGKTEFVRAFALACGVDPAAVVSPTFVLHQRYTGDRSIDHIDAYRLNDDDEFVEMGGDELVHGESVCFVEWGERVSDCLPADRLELQIDVRTQDSRTLRLSATGPQSAALVGALADRLDSSKSDSA